MKNEISCGIIYALQWCITDEEKIRSQKFVDSWDRGGAVSREFEFTNAETKKNGYAKATLSMTDEGLLVELQDFRGELEIREQLHEELDKVKTEERQKSDYLSKMSHEIRTPMNGILGMITLAKTHIDNTEEALKCLEKANGLSQFLLSLIDDILDMSKIERGKVVLEHERFVLLEVYNKICEIFAGSIEQKGIEFDTKMKDMDIRYVVGDSLRLTQILVNFVSNANKYTERGGNGSDVPSIRPADRTNNGGNSNGAKFTH